MSDIEEQPTISVITILRGEKEFIPLIKDNFNTFEYPQDKLELVIVDDGKRTCFISPFTRYGNTRILTKNRITEWQGENHGKLPL